MAIDSSTIIAAVSGGIDSCVLLHQLHLKSLASDTPLIVVHVDHQLRKTSAEDAIFVQDLCQAYGRPCHVVAVKVNPKGNRQANARSQRYAALARLAHNSRTRRVATGHHAHDQFENEQLRQRMGRFGDLWEWREMPEWDICLWRPLIALDRAQIRAYAEQHGLNWREDESNLSPVYLRNQVRDLTTHISEKPITPTQPFEPVRIAAHRWWVASLEVEDLAHACRTIPGIQIRRAALDVLSDGFATAAIATHGALIRRTPSGFEVIRTTCQGARNLPAEGTSMMDDVRKRVKMEF